MSPIATGRVKIEVETLFDSKERVAPETFDVGKDLGSPVALDYYDRAPFEFKGKILKIHIRYL